MSAEVLNYPYRPNPVSMLVGMAFCAALAVGMVVLAASRHGGLVIDGLITLSPGQATLFYWCGAALMVAGCALALFMLAGALLRPARLVLTETELRLPRHLFSRRVLVVRLAGLTRLDEQVLDTQRMLHIRWDGKRVTVVRSLLPGAEAYEQLFIELARRVPGRPAAGS